MIVVVCLNPAVDLTLRVSQLVPGRSHRSAPGSRRAGGKGTNVARVLRRLGQDVRLIAPVGGESGAEFVRDLDGVVELQPIAVHSPTRCCVAIVDDTDATVVNETGSALAAEQLHELEQAVVTAAAPGDVVVLSGSLPPGLPDDTYARLLDALPGVRAVVDTSGPALTGCLRARPAVVAPNLHEVRAALARPDLSARDAATALRELGACAAVVSDGPAGVVAATGTDVWVAAPPRVVRGNPTGAGDAVTAALAAGLARDLGWAQLLAGAVAVSAAAVAWPVAGGFDDAVRREVEAAVEPSVVEHERGSR